ncbi:MAG: 4-hydroxy-tetrahydrodipicolinate synthase [Rickettsiales bacterium]|nr:4-hydroxy-tetrahydrodipicolinate synthase [Rickettsiales bacterium]
MFKGIFTALITPFKNNQIDVPAFAKIIEYQIENGVSGIVPCGTTGESPTVSHEEHEFIIEQAVKIANGRIKVVAGTGSNSTKESIELTQAAEKLGADAALLVTPYYNKPTQEGLYLHFKTIHDQTNIPIILYNIPGRSIIDLSNETLERLFKLERIVGIKDATGDLTRPIELQKVLSKDIAHFSGEDDNALDFYQTGGNGIISVTSNILPNIVADVFKNWSEGNLDEAKKLQESLKELNSALFCETNPIPIKFAMAKTGFCSDEIRLPLTSPSKEAQTKILNAIKKFNLYEQS